jgi:polysaccharide biosynthesis/export protein
MMGGERVMAKSAWGGAVMVVVLLAGCAHQTKRVPAVPDEPYRVGLEDVLDVSVWRDPELSRTVPVRPDGYISLPLAGEILAAGKTAVELEAVIKQKLAPFFQEPRVTVIVSEVNSPRVYVTGEVARPGAYPLRGRVSVLQAIALAGGFSDFANSRRIVVLRNQKTGGAIRVNYEDLIDASAKERLDFFLMPGDTVVVP